MKTETLIERTKEKWSKEEFSANIINDDGIIICRMIEGVDKDNDRFKQNTIRLCKAVNNYDSLLSALKDYYLHLQIESNKSMRVAIETDLKRAELRNLISHVTGEDCEDIQNKCEEEARKVAEQ